MMQPIGVGGSEAAILGGMLDLCPATLFNQFLEMEEAISLTQRWFSIQEIKANIMELEKQFLDKDEDGDMGLEVSGDTWWDKRGTGSDYDSDSGCRIITGNKTKRVLTACPISWKCRKCETKKDHTEECCPKKLQRKLQRYGSLQFFYRCQLVIL
jgi:hypothetical protein